LAKNPPSFAFIEMEDPRDADDAVRALDGTQLCGMKAHVEMARDKDEKATRFQEKQLREQMDKRKRRLEEERRRDGERSPRRHSRSPKRSRNKSGYDETVKKGYKDENRDDWFESSGPSRECRKKTVINKMSSREGSWEEGEIRGGSEEHREEGRSPRRSRKHRDSREGRRKESDSRKKSEKKIGKDVKEDPYADQSSFR